MDEDLRALGLTRSGGIFVGNDATTGRAYYISLRDLTQTSVHVVGAAGYGKSYWLRNLVDQFVRQQQAFGIFDPHSELCEYAAWRLRRAGVLPHRIVPLNFRNADHALGFNPLSCGPSDPEEAAGLVLDAFVRVWGAKSMDETPRMEGILRGLFRLLIAGGLTLLEAPDVLNVDNSGLRRALRERVGDRLVQADWCEFEKLGRPEKLQLVESARNRLRRVLHAAPVQAMLGQSTNTLDLREVMDSGRFLLADLGSIAAPEVQRLLGTFLMNAIFHAARRRNTRRRRPWFLICDEFAQFVSPDIANALDQLRKSGCHLVCCHQRLRQLEREDGDVLSAVMTNCKIKVVFGGLERPEAERMSRELFTGQVTGERVKHIAVATKFRPVMGTFVVETESGSESESESESWGTSSASGDGDSEGESLSYRGPGPADTDDELHGRSQGRQWSSSESESAGGGRGTSTTRGWSRSIAPITNSEEFREETGRQFHSLEEEWERHVGQVHGLAKRQALVRVYDGPVLHMVTPDVGPERCDARQERFQTTVMERCPQVKALSAVTVEIEDRREMAALAETAESAGRPFAVRTFRE